MFRKKRFVTTKDDFLELFTRLPLGLGCDFNEVHCVSAFYTEKKIRDDKYELRDLFNICGIPYTKTYQSFYYAGWKTFTELMGLRKFGFRSLEAIDRIMAADKDFLFAEQVYKNGMFADFYDEEIVKNRNLADESLRESGIMETCFSFFKTPWLYEQVRILLENCSETTTGYIIEEFLKHPRKMKIRTNQFFRTYKKVYVFDLFIELMKSSNKKTIKEVIVPKMREQGITKKTYKEVLQKILSGYDECIFPAKEERICYTPEELELEWKYANYNFVLPKKYGMVYKLNHKVFVPNNTGLDVDVTDRVSIELYVKQGLKYKYLFELIEWEESGFELVDVSIHNKVAFSKNDIKMIALWCKEKNVSVDTKELQAIALNKMTERLTD